MRINLLIALSAALIGLSELAIPTSIVWGDIFFDDFNDGAANTPLTARTAVSGQSWSGPAFGGASLLMTTGSGQGGTLGVGSTSNPNLGADNAAPLGQTLSSGIYTYSADISVQDPRPRNQLFIVGDVLSANNVTFGMDHGSIFFEGVYLGHPSVPTGFATNAVFYNIHVAMTFDLDGETGSVSWFDLDDPTDATTSGDVDLLGFTNGFGVGNYAFTRLIVSETPPSAGFDNVRLTTPAQPLLGDYNLDGTVDAADYVVWRKTNIDGSFGYSTWRQHYGSTNHGAGSGSFVNSTVSVPEPTSFAIAIAATMLVLTLMRRRIGGLIVA